MLTIRVTHGIVAAMPSVPITPPLASPFDDPTAVRRSGPADAPVGELSPVGEPAQQPGADVADPSPRDRRSLLAEDLLAELTRWQPSERMGAFRHWSRGALSLVHLNVVAALEVEGALPMHRLAELLDVSQASATGIVDRMERRGIVERRRAAEDRRLVMVHLGPAGAGLFRDLERQHRDRLSRLLQGLSEKELSGFLVGLRAMRAARARLAAADEAAGVPEAEPRP